jgi:hypothetical protein
MRRQRQTECEKQGGGEGKGLEHRSFYLDGVLCGRGRFVAAVIAPGQLNRT